MMIFKERKLLQVVLVLWLHEYTYCRSNHYDGQMTVSEMLETEVPKIAVEQEKESAKYDKMVGLSKEKGIYSYGKSIDLNYPGRIILYFAFDASERIGANNLKKSIEVAKAVVQKVAISEHGSRAGALTFNSQRDAIFYPMAYNTTKQVVEALDKFNFVGGGTSNEMHSVLTQIRESTLPLVREWIPEKKSALFIFTDGKANMDGNLIQEARWLEEEGVEIFCIGITSDINHSLLYAIASTSKYGRNREKRPNVFILQDYKILGWLVNEIVNFSVDFPQCGIGMKAVGAKNLGYIMDGEVSKAPWPWMAAIFVNDAVPPQFRFVCGGSVIHPRFILTAAHCLYKSDIPRNRSELLVKIGLTDFRMNTRHQYEVRKIIKHPKYIRMDSYDNDIALLELKQPIEYDTEIRPICLPPKVEKCPNPGSPENGYKIGSNYSIDSKVQFKCNENFALMGSAERQCQSNGEWSGALPNCTINILKCPDPGSPQNGYKIGSDYSIGAKVKFECKENFELLGSSESQCHSNGQWSGTLPSCMIQFIKCPHPGSLENGYVIGSDYSIGAKVKFECNEDFELLGSSERQCQSNRQWSGTLPSCIIDYKADLYLPDSIVWAAGWGEVDFREEFVIKPGQNSRYLKEIPLPIQSKEKCRQSLRDEKPQPIPDEFFTSRMFCAGTGTEGYDICKGDSGGPVMKPTMNENGYLSWTQVGIISWGPGCGQKSAYAFQTKVQDYRQWIDEEIEKALKLLT